jgi:hypothetical protein
LTIDHFGLKARNMTDRLSGSCALCDFAPLRLKLKASRPGENGKAETLKN